MFRQIVAVAAVALGGCSVPTQQEIADADYGQYPAAYEAVVRAYMAARLKDPDSAQYQFLNAPKQGWDAFGKKRYGWVTCVQINAKNSYGGYTGNRLHYFMLRGDQVVDVGGSDNDVSAASTRGRCQRFVS